MAATHVALFRGINVGTAKRIAMKDLAAALVALGCSDVRTLLNSGNVVFAAPRAWRGDMAERIRKSVLERTGVQSRVTVLTVEEWAEVARHNPLAREGRTHSRLLVSIPAEGTDRTALAALAKQEWDTSEIALGRRAIYTWCATGLLDSPVAKEIARLLGERVTSRNWATVLKLAALAAPAKPAAKPSAKALKPAPKAAPKAAASKTSPARATMSRGRKPRP